MQKQKPAADPDAYVRALRGWKQETVAALRAAVKSAADLEEAIKWGPSSICGTAMSCSSARRKNRCSSASHAAGALLRSTRF
ncbi:MAG: hypothetical protein Kow00133_03410 [Amphiplicatus sp.]